MGIRIGVEIPSKAKFIGHKSYYNIYDACDEACEMLKAAGFELREQSRITEARYLGFPGRPHLLRVATHKQKHPPIGLSTVAAKITFATGGVIDHPNMVKLNQEKLEGIVATAIGYYMLKSSVPHVSEYKGKKGTW